MPALLVTAKNSLKLQKREETQKKRGKKGGKIRIRLLNDIYPKKSEQYLGPRRKGVKDHQFRKIAMTERSLTL